MKTSKNYDHLPIYYYRPEFDRCLDCGAPLKRSHTAWQKTIISLQGTARVYNQAYRCRDRDLCSQPELVYRSAYADGLSLAYYSYGLDVIVLIGQQRFRQHQTISEIQGWLWQREKPIQISEREVQYLVDAYLLLSACSHGRRLERYRPQIEANQGLILAIDAAKPEKGQPGLYLFRDALTGCRLHSALLYSGDADSLAQELRQVVALGFPIQAVISDDEAATRTAVATVLPEKPHGLCHLHFLQAVQEPIRQADSQLASQLKSPLRPITKLERHLAQQPERLADLSADQQVAVRGYLDAVRAVMFLKGRAPFRLTGLPMYEALAQVTASLERSQAEQPHLFLARLQSLTGTYAQHQEKYDQIKPLQAWFLGLADLLDVPETPRYQWSCQTGAEVAQALTDYLDDWALLPAESPLASQFFTEVRTRLDHWAPGLYWTYELPLLPRTNNALEVTIGDLKEQYRRITGRRCLKEYLMRYGPYLTFDDDQDDPEELLTWFQAVDRQDFLDERAKLEHLRQRLRNMHRFRQDPETFLAELERLWRSSA
jgi:hypothetical protein